MDNFKDLAYYEKTFVALKNDGNSVILYKYNILTRNYKPDSIIEDNCVVTKVELTDSDSRFRIAVTLNEDDIIKIWTILKAGKLKGIMSRRSSALIKSKNLDTLKNKRYFEIQVLEGKFRGFDVSRNQDCILAASYDNSIYVWNRRIYDAKDIKYELGQILRSSLPRVRRLLKVKISEDRKLIVSDLEDEKEERYLELWKINQNLKPTNLENKEEFLLDPKYKLFETRKIPNDLFPHIKNVKTDLLDKKIILLHDTERLIVWRADSASSGTNNQKINGHMGKVTSVEFNKEKELIVTASTDRTIKIWRCDDNQNVSSRNDPIYMESQVITGHTGSVTCLCLSLDTDFLVSGSEDNFVKVWVRYDKRFGEYQTLAEHYGGVLSVVISADKKLIASSSLDSSIKIFQMNEDVKEFQLKQSLYEGIVDQIVLTRDSNFMIFGHSQSQKNGEIMIFRQVKKLEYLKDGID